MRFIVFLLTPNQSCNTFLNDVQHRQISNTYKTQHRTTVIQIRIYGRVIIIFVVFKFKMFFTLTIMPIFFFWNSISNKVNMITPIQFDIYLTHRIFFNINTFNVPIFYINLCELVGKWLAAILTGQWIRRTEPRSSRYILNWSQFHDAGVIACTSLLISLSGKLHWSIFCDCPVFQTDCDFMVAVFEMAVMPANFRKWKLSLLQTVHKYANWVDPKRHMTFHSRNAELSGKYFVIWA